ncbi:MAG: glycosyltransferase family 2 protein, partial [bacterium]
RHQVKPSSPQDVIRHEKRYLDLEISLKKLTSLWGFVVGAYGCINSFRTRLYRPLGKRPLHDDVIIPLSITAQGYKFLFEERAKTWESVPSNFSAEFKRRKRMAALNLSTLFPMLKLSYASGIKVLITAIFYKVFRWASPFLILGMLVGSLGGSFDFLFFRRVAGVLWGLVFLSLSGGLLLRWGIQLPILSSLYYFASMNLAQLLGFFEGLKGAPATWETRS